MLLARSSLCGDWDEDSSLSIAKVMRKKIDAKGYYSMLGVDVDATDSEIRAAGKSLIMRSHPDHGGDSESFIKAVEAYRTLSKPESRAEYDNCTDSPKVGFRTDYSGLYDALSAAGEPAWYKEPSMILSEEELNAVRTWHMYLLEAAREFRLSLKIKAGVCRCPAGYYEQGDYALIGKGTVPERWAAYVYMLRRMVTK